MAVPRVSALLMLRSTLSTVSAPATNPFRGSITNPTQLLCTLRGRRYRRLTQHLLPGGPLRPYPGRSCTGWTAPAYVGAFVAVGARVTPRPPHGSVRASLCIRLLPRVPDGETLVGPGMKDSRLWEPVIRQLRHSSPGDTPFLTASAELPAPAVGDLGPQQSLRP